MLGTGAPRPLSCCTTSCSGGVSCSVPWCFWWFNLSAVSDSPQPHGWQPSRLLCPWDSPGKTTGVSGHFLLQGVSPTQESNPGLLHRRQVLYHLSHQGSPELELCLPSQGGRLHREAGLPTTSGALPRPTAHPAPRGTEGRGPRDPVCFPCPDLLPCPEREHPDKSLSP